MRTYLVLGAVIAALSITLYLERGEIKVARAETKLVRAGFEGYIAAQTIETETLKRDQRKNLLEAEREWNLRVAEVRKDGDAYWRCVAAGRCGAPAVRVCESSGEAPASGKIPPVPSSNEGDGARSGAVSVASGETTAESQDPNPGLTADCRAAVERANFIQDKIEAQDGY